MYCIELADMQKQGQRDHPASCSCKGRDSVITQLPSRRAAARESGTSLLPRDHPSTAIACAHAPPLVAAKGGGRSWRVRPVNQTPTAATPPAARRRPPHP